MAKILDKLEIPYVITGGMAVSVWGRPRSTMDIDIIVKLEPKNVQMLIKELLNIDKDVYVSEDAIKEALERKGEFNFIDPNTQLKVDFWIVKNIFNQQEIQRAVPQEFEGYHVQFVSPEDLILSKLLWHQESYSTKQLDDIKSVLAISKVDMEYIKNWAEKQDTIEILNTLLSEIK
ncbi:MAG: hypothetical protein A2908_03005 [Candidatus Staskawiczbacteria bacterium RIFCSPLOWO2_01_FULL_38_12b]|uniref:DUF6036 domain-containing protein n=1 Tax=Candidatus Staskawiczbacteria bacterium RIFCSPLOWO2_01_FULL_38_12b TaxID=1802214 RepID=A0A1G2IE03_9BACT|nr:MAG: hypothetical protein A2908_03005 [Candidatus Staskawiczbacteria bacterium RIFCSPLOWO2_01_FULL_38_12b]